MVLTPDRDADAQLDLASTTAETGRLHAWLDAAAAALPERTGFALRLCLEEAVMNVVLHGYGERSPGPLSVSLWFEPESVIARLVDRAPPFDPSQALAAVGARLDGAGGRGLALMHRFASALGYERAGSQNRLTLAFTRQPARPPPGAASR